MRKIANHIVASTASPELVAEAKAMETKLDDPNISLRELAEIFIRSDSMIQFALDHAEDDERMAMEVVAGEGDEALERMRVLAKRIVEKAA